MDVGGTFLPEIIFGMRSLFCSIIVCLLAHAAVAANWYVAPNGNDNNAGSLAAPFKTIEQALDAAAPGDVINLRAGAYTSHEIRITKSNLTLRSYPGEWAKIVCSVEIEDEASCIWYSEPEVTGGLLENIEIVGGYYYGIKFETNWDWGLPQNQIRGVRNVTVRGCKIHDTGRDCIKITPACAGLHFLSCEIYNSGVGPSNSPANGGPNAEGIDNVNGDGMVVRHCYIHNISTSGVYVKGGAKDCIIEENLIYGVFEGGILLGFYTDAEFFDQDGTNPAYYECQYSVARNNIVYNTGGAGIGFFAARNCSAYNNTIVTASGSFHAPLYFSPGEIWIDDNTTLTPPNFFIEVYNNIVIDQSGSGDEDFTLQIREGALLGANLIDYNIYRKNNGAAKFDDGVSWPALTFSQWKAQLGFDTHSSEQFPMTDNNLHLLPGSPAINAGRNSPAQRDYDGVPRNGAPDIGADEYNNGSPLPIPPGIGVVGTGAAGSTSALADIPETPLFELFPNPANDYIHLSPLPPNADLRLYSSTGDQVNAALLSDRTIDLRALPAGLYYLEIRSAQGRSLGVRAFVRAQ